MLLSEEDVPSLAAAIEPGSSAGALVWENTWPHRSPLPYAVRAVSWWPAAASPSRRCSPQSKLTRKKKPMRTPSS